MSQTVLVADDSNTIRQIVEMALKASPFDVVGVGSAQDAMDAARQQPSVILLDYYMPDGSGYDVCRALKSDAGTSGIPVIMLGGTYKNFDENLARQSGADGILMKPFKTDALINAVQSASTGGATAGAPADAAVQAAARPSQPPQHQQPSEPEPVDLEPEPMELEVEPEPVTPQPHHQAAQARTPSTPPPAGSQPRIATPDVNASSRQPSSGQPQQGAPSAGGSGMTAVGGMSRSEIEKLVKEEVKNAVRSELPGLLRNIMGEVFQQKVLPKLVQHAEERVDSLVSQQLGGQIQNQVRAELERLLSEE